MPLFGNTGQGNWNTTQLTAPTLDWNTFKSTIAPTFYSGDPRGVLGRRDQWADQLGWNVGGKANFRIEGLDRDQFFSQLAGNVNQGYGDNAGSESLSAMEAAMANPQNQQAWRAAVDKALADPSTIYRVMGDRLTNVDGSAATNEGAQRAVRYQLKDGKLVPIAQFDSDRNSTWASIRDDWLPYVAAIAGAGYLSGAGIGEVAAGNGAFLGEGAASGVGAWDAAAGLGAAGGYTPAGVASAVGGVGTPTATQGYQLGQLAGQAAGAGGAGGVGGAASPGAYIGVGSSPAAGAGAGYSAGGLAPVVNATAIPGLGANTANMTLGEALLDLGGSYMGSLSTKDWIQLISSGYNWMQADDLRDRSAGIDPFGAYRAGYARQLADLMANPSSVTKQPGYTDALKASEQALTRNLAAQGLTGSGTAAEALAKFGGQFQNQYYQEQIARLAGLAGANFNNAPTALQADIAGMNAQNQIINNLVKILPYLGLG